MFCCLQKFESEEQGQSDQSKTVTTENVKPLGGGGEQEKPTVTSDKELQVRIYLNELVLFKITFCFICLFFLQSFQSGSTQLVVQQRNNDDRKLITVAPQKLQQQLTTDQVGLVGKKNRGIFSFCIGFYCCFFLTDNCQSYGAIRA